MFDLSSEVITTRFEMLDKNNNDYYYNDYDNIPANPAYDINFEELELVNQHPNQPISSRYPPYQFDQQPHQPQVQQVQTPIQTQVQTSHTSQASQTPTSYSPDYHYNNPPQPSNLDSYNMMANSMNIDFTTPQFGVNMNLSDTPQVDSPTMMFPVQYDYKYNQPVAGSIPPGGNNQPLADFNYDTHMAQQQAQMKLQHQLQQEHQPQHQPQPQAAYLHQQHHLAQVQGLHQQMASVPPPPTTTSSRGSRRGSSYMGTPKEGTGAGSRKRDDNKIITSNTNKHRIIRGIAAGGSNSRPPKESTTNPNSVYLPIELELAGGGVDACCRPQWSLSENEDKRRIIRIERIQHHQRIYANFSIVGSANENPSTLPPPINSNIDVIEVSCLQCSKQLNREINESGGEDGLDYDELNEEDGYDYYITSVEGIEIVELLIGTMSNDSNERRKERGRVRSNLVPFWSKKPISSRLDQHNNQSQSDLSSYSQGGQSQNSSPLNSNGSLGGYSDYRTELAKRIMSYEIRKPRGFDKEVRILRWERLIPALKRALQSYYCEIPANEQLEL